VAEVVRRALALATPLVEVTGGEPLLQPEVHSLMAALLAGGKTVLLETSGSIDVGTVDPRVVKIVDLKCPDSGEAAANLWPNLERLTARDEVKFVVASRKDYEWARDVIRRTAIDRRCTVLAGVVHGAIEPRALVEWILEDGLPVRFQLQMHKYIWPPDARGV
jgi:7-carboxy-7-deazaguanine synthase